ncbi:MAG TPA: phosphoadenylyl-sulfate reductase [Chthonomonas sp.]|uniref:phosphoadenylyl-sulfate reductase n=1 Tax=Chthonomonas sp. TaxID=2282153 RepID=UPI002B4AE90F|nr:phosphoadenylyl-sulfate reductase [Chthonomonas sp.]HLI49256.1 phosphoadenylyl-sulfate reductase [Chthonomonas sp.]
MTLPPPSREALTALSNCLEEHSPQEILAWAVKIYGERLAMATAFGAEGCVLLDMLAQFGPLAKLPFIFNLETGYQFPETLALRERIQERYGLTVHFVRPEETVEQMEARFGGPIYHTNPDECCRLRKIVPLRKVLKDFDAWVSAIRRDQTPDRAQAGIVEWDSKFGLVKISPLANWTREDVWAYIRTHNVPYNPLHDRGYPSIGCWPCTRPVREGEDERAGRWAGLQKTECGLHSRRPVRSS